MSAHSRLASVKSWFGSLGKRFKKASVERLDCRCTGMHFLRRSIIYNVLSVVTLFSSSDPNSSTANLFDEGAVVPAALAVGSLAERYRKWKEWYDARAARESPQDVVIYSDEVLRENSNLDVPLQVKHTTTEAVISKLNEVLGTSYSSDIPGLAALLERCIERRYDFGTAFGRLRSFWFDDVVPPREGHAEGESHKSLADFTGVMKVLDEREREDSENRVRAVDRERNMIIDAHIRPRRIWDLYSNRVIPMCAVKESSLEHCGGIWAISHSWVKVKRRRNVDTPINGHEWLVPLPDDITLDRVRVELLNLGAVYAWLDLLCLRQEDVQKIEKEEIRKEEWELDVPMIGSVYIENPHIVTYLSGLGRPLKERGTGDERHWMNRAWTLQEGSSRTLIGGMTSHSHFPTDANMEFQISQDRFYTRLGREVNAANDPFATLFSTLEAMLDRKATHEIDRIYGLASILPRSESRGLSLYSRGEDTPATHEKAWSDLIVNLDGDLRLQFAFLYPTPGDGGVLWKPSWKQLAAKTVPLVPLAIFENRLSVLNSTVREDGTLTLSAFLVKNCLIQSLAEPDGKKYCRRGELTVIGVDGKSIDDEYPFAVEAHHQELISADRSYVLAAPRNDSGFPHWYWIVGIEVAPGSIRKITVLTIDSWYKFDKLQAWNIGTEAEITLLCILLELRNPLSEKPEFHSYGRIWWTLYRAAHMGGEGLALRRREWFVPIPRDMDLDRLRIELLNLGAEFAWLDVLCLKQEDTSSLQPENLQAEDKRTEEWKLDVPTIGGIYRGNAHIVTYLSGLGRQFEIGDTQNERHWIKRAWTLQEGSTTTLFGGMTDRSPLPPNSRESQAISDGQRDVQRYYSQLCMALNAGHNMYGDLFPALEAMLGRQATYQVDKVAGLTYILLSLPEESPSASFPVYVRGGNDPATLESAWSDLIKRMHDYHRVQLAFLYPAPGIGASSWRPSWNQLQAAEAQLPVASHIYLPEGIFFGGVRRGGILPPGEAHRRGRRL
ncbi:hypothetical protein NM688_g2660 [Phlebia brevispora]|uniref:Uncharacterized protein n=1 Tax=Phlebia brevispora TaxID=194682 RepID=A0ACC1T807_9APHY|nr:hypothetical protein NM688_g2660 [Phlebia brevispora]